MEKLIKKRTNLVDSPLYYVSLEDTFDVIKRAHIATGHGGRDRMIKELQRKYVNITTKSLELYKSLCEECQKKRKRPMTKGVVVRPILTKEFSSRGQVDLIDMQSMPHSQNKWILVYQDHLTKFCVLRPLTTKRAAEVAFQLIDIFLLFGAPAILQSDNGSEFTASVITDLKLVWPKLALVHGKPRHPQSQGSVERANGDIKDMLVAWLADNNTQDWTIGIKFVQFQKNSAHHSGIKCSPYSAMFGCEARVGLTSLSLPTEVINTLENEDDLAMIFDDFPPASTDISTPDDFTLPDINTAKQPSDTGSSLGEIIQNQTPSQVIEENTAQIRINRENAHTAQVVQAERMVKRSRLDLQAGIIGDNVAVPIPAVDRGRGDPRNILGVIIHRDLNTDQYTIGVKAGILKGQYSRNQFDLCPQRLLSETGINTETLVTLRTAVIAQSASGGQGFVKCNCSGPSKCKTNRCKCFKAKLKCNSRCHGSLTCANK